MGLTRIGVKVKRDTSSRAEREIECLVDSGAVHSVVPKDALKALGIKPYKSVTFILANGETVDRPLRGRRRGQ